MTKLKDKQITFRTHTLGCKVNLYESEAINSLLCDEGWQLASSDEDANVQIINTCTVTKMSDAKSRKLIRSLIRKNPKAIIVVMGCYSQLNPTDILSIEGVDIVLGSEGRKKIPEYVYEYFDKKKQLNRVTDVSKIKHYEDLKVSRLTNHTRGFIKIQDGCENFCSYCAIPFARGPIRSRDPIDVLKEINHLVNVGVKEVILAGINTGTYGQDLTNYNLPKLIDEILIKIPQLARLRLSSIELMEVSDDLLDLFERYPTRLARHLHIPLQAGSNTVLKRMKRRYLKEDYEAKIKKIRSRFPDLAITTDCLAGFVGETEDEFQEALLFIEQVGFQMMHIFPYSRRKNTEADNLPNHLEKEIIENRTKILLNLAKKLQKNYLKQMINTEAVVLIEQKKQDEYFGHTSNYVEVKVKSTQNIINKMVRVLITNIDNQCEADILEVID